MLQGLPWDKILEAVKAALRSLILAILPIFMAYFQTLPVEWAGLAYLLLVWLDKFLHEVWKDGNRTSKWTGLAPF